MAVSLGKSGAPPFIFFPKFASLFTIAAGCLTLIGWIIGSHLLTDILPGFVSMKPNTAVGFILAGISLLLLSRDATLQSPAAMAVTKFFALIVTLLGFFTLAEYIFRFNSSFDQLLFVGRSETLVTSHPVRMGMNSALNFVLVGLNLLFIDRETLRGRRPGQIFCLIAAIISSLAFLGHIYRIAGFYKIEQYTQMALDTAITFLVLCLGLFYARPKSGFMRRITGTGAGSMIARNMLPAAILVPMAFGWMVLAGFRLALYNADFGFMLFVTIIIIFITVLIWVNAGLLNRSELAHSDTGRILRQSEARFRATFEQAAVGLAHVALDGRFIRVNEKLCTIVGYSRSELRQKTFQDITYPEDLEADLEYVRQLLSGEIRTYSMEKRYIRKDGTITWIHLTVSLVPEAIGEPGYFISVIQDINDRKMAEEEILKLKNELEDRVLERTEELRESEEKYRTLFLESKDAVFMSTPDGKFLDINPAGIELFGYESKGELLRIDIAESHFVDANRRKQLRDAIHHNGHVKDFELVLKKKNGEVFTVLETSNAVHDGEGNVIAYQGILRDITRMKQIQDQLLQSQKLETIGRLAGGVAHDFNNRLMAINNYCELILLKIPVDSLLINDVKEILKATDRAASLTKQLLAFGRKQMLSSKVIDLNSVINNVKNMIQLLIGENIKVLFHLEPNLSPVKADPGQVEQVLLNLAVNGRDAMVHGGTLSVETQNIVLDENYQKHHPYVKPGNYGMIVVKDDGEGMDDETLSHLFEPFFTTKEQGKGTGLGLSTVYGTIKQSDGYIEVSSKKGEGTRFEIYFPQN